MGSVTHWIGGVKRGEEQAAAALWKRYYERLVRYARRKLEDQPRRVVDEEDVAAVAFGEFCRAARKGRFPDLSDRNGLWRLLLCITACRAADVRRRNYREMKWLRGESALPNWDGEAGMRALAEVVGSTPTPEFVAASTEACRRLFALLGDADLRTVARLKLASYKNAEIAEVMDCALRTVERKLKVIRKVWKAELGTRARVSAD